MKPDWSELYRRSFGPRAVDGWPVDVSAHWGAWRERLQGLPVLVPRDVEQVGQMLRLAREHGATVLPCGNGSRLGWHAPPEGVDVLLSTRALDAIVAHEPADGTLCAQAGARLADLRRAAREHGQVLSVDGAFPERTTLGGSVSLGESGVDRLRYGPLRHQILGAQVALSDGRAVSCGGRLVKNVTGYDLHRLYCGSRGRLCVITEVALRLRPAPAREILLEGAAPDGAELFARCRALLELPARFVSLCVYRGCAGASTPRTRDYSWQIVLRLAGSAGALRGELELVRRVWPAALTLEDSAASTRAEELRDLELGAPGAPLARVSCRPTRLAPLFAILEAFWSELGERPPCRIEPGLARVEWAWAPARQAQNEQRASALAGRIAPLAAHLSILRAGPGVAANAARSADLDAARALSRRIQQALDPSATFGGWV